MSKSVQSAREHFTWVLQENNLKVTQARLAVMAVLRKQGKPLSVQKINEALSDTGIDQATVYRTLRTLQKSGVVQSIDFQHGHAHFELIEGKHHHHVVCRGCGKVQDIEDCRIERMQDQALAQSGFADIEQHSLEFFGTCKPCEKLS